MDTFACQPDPFAAARKRMVEEQLPPVSARVRAAMSTVPRHEFIPPDQRVRAYDDCALPIGCGQTISQPYIVAYMTDALELRPADRVLEIGTGSGYQAAVLARLVAEVYSIEIVEPLARRAADVLRKTGCANIHLRTGNGSCGWPEAAPFDAVIVTCGPEQIPPSLVEQLKDGGRMMIPIGPLGEQTLLLLRKNGGRLEKESALPARFVPMTGPK